MEKNSTKMSLATAVCIIIIFLLVVALIFVYLQNEKRTSDLEDKIALLEDQITISQQETNKNITVETNNIVNNTTSDNTNSDFKLLKSAEIDEILQPDAATFCIEDIKQSGDDYIIYAIMLEDTPRKLTDSEYNSLLNGGKIEFRNQKWEMSSDGENVIYIKSGEDILLIEKDEKFFGNIAGAAARLCDYSNQKIAFKVSKNIIIGTDWQYFEYNNNGKIEVYADTENEAHALIKDYKGLTFDELLEESKGCKGFYDECAAYVRNGVIDAIRINSFK